MKVVTILALVGLSAGAGTLVYEHVTQSSSERFILSLEEIQKLELEDHIPASDPETTEPINLETPFSALVDEARNSSIWPEFKRIISTYNFTSPEEWAITGNRMAFVFHYLQNKDAFTHAADTMQVEFNDIKSSLSPEELIEAKLRLTEKIEELEKLAPSQDEISATEPYIEKLASVIEATDP